ncbi:MAG TPA: energy-coupled thiamine transporter ThiT [Bavariicoccus seileri]|uniref:Energy-coupled thiamine transporter ThiT n=1 Tax=Bavariicoccus seileri TaxID=549685 RepID=A0A3D4S4T4_9ENTE|nr:energy-coupled thiamine transporter ThiT [Bavariicoccus seileri]HCS93824.1 energy-coupled thiamine transporter ThiT [Bavariicoccus seileri]
MEKSATFLKSINVWVEIAIVAALAMVLTFIPADIGWIQISLGTVIVGILAFRRGTVPALIAGLLWGLLHFLKGFYILSPTQFTIEYILAFACMGFAGLVYPQFQKALADDNSKAALKYLVIGMLIGTFIKYFWHFVAGYVFWGSYAWASWGAFSYSLVVNGVSFILTAVYCTIVSVLLFKTSPRLFKAQDKARGYR